MKQLRTLFVGAFAALLLSSLSLVVVVAGAELLDLPAVSSKVILFALASGAVLGFVARPLAHLSGTWESGVLLLLIALALAALAVLLGGYEERAWEPLAIYAVGLLNALLIAPASSALATRERTPPDAFLSR